MRFKISLKRLFEPLFLLQKIKTWATVNNKNDNIAILRRFYFVDDDLYPFDVSVAVWGTGGVKRVFGSRRRDEN